MGLKVCSAKSPLWERSTLRHHTENIFMPTFGHLYNRFQNSSDFNASVDRE